MQKTANPRKQRKRLFNAPAHKRHKLMGSPLSTDLFAQRGFKTLPVRKGDTVRIMRGDHKGFEGKVSRVDLKHYRVYVEGLTREKVDGSTVFVGLHPSKIMIKNLNLDDKRRKAILERKKPIIKKGEKPAKKAPATKKPAETKKPTKKAEEEPAEEAKIVLEPEVAKETAPGASEPAEKKPAAKRKRATKAEGGN
jgi:large subunit ribosomal protein L24